MTLDIFKIIIQFTQNFSFILKSNQLNFIILVTYKTYADTCSSILLCKPSTGLTCPSTATGCACPTTLTANQCDCPTTHYWDSASSKCLAKSSESGSCTNDYMCKYISFLIYA